MAEYISREAAIVKATKVLADDFDAYNVKVSLQAIPPADVVEVVRCGECIRKYICRTSNVWAVSPDDNWFCADGKRKDGGQDDV